MNFVKVKAISDVKAKKIIALKNAIEEVNQIKEGKLKGTPTRDLLNIL